MRTPNQQNPLPWQPQELIQTLLTKSADQLTRELGRHLLLVRLNDFSRELTLGLQQGQPPGANKGHKMTLAFTLSAEQLKELDELSKSPRSVPRSVPRSLPVPSAPLPPEWRDAPCYLLPLKDRTRSIHGIISVGRTASNDIVLDHASVSGQHAELRIDGVPAVRDLESRNHTFVDGERVTEWRELAVGNILKFGAVQAVLCSPASLLAAVSGRL